MGAYLHLRGLTDVDEIAGSNMNRFCYSNGPTSGASEIASTSNTGGFDGNGNSAAASSQVAVGDCSNFWAGQLDDVFEELEDKAGYGDAPRERSELSGRAQDDVKIMSGGGLEEGQTVKGDFGSRKRGSIEKACGIEHTEKKSSEHANFVKCGRGLRASHQRVVNDTKSMASYTGDVGGAAAAARSGNSGVVLPGEGEITSFLGDGDFFEGLEGVGLPLQNRSHPCEELTDETERLPDHLLIEVLVRVPTRDWPAAASVKKRWAQLFKGDGLWHSALMKKWPGATFTKRWPGPIARGSSKRRYIALHVSDSLFAKDKVEGMNEMAGHAYLYLKEQLESSTPPVSYGLLHGTIIDQFLACCKTGDEAHNMASHIWVAVLDNLDESESTFLLLMRIAEEWEVFLPYPYSKSHAVQWRLFERLFTDFRDCLSQYNYFDVLTRARSKFELIPQTWLGY